MQHLLKELLSLIQAMHVNLMFSLSLLGCLWLVNIVNFMLGGRLNILGIYPRHLLGLPGIIFSPFLHGNFNHLFFNSFPLFILGNLIMLYSLPTFYCVSLVVIIASGLAIWLIGRRAFHIGASGLLMGYWGYLLVRAYHDPTIMAVILGIVSLYYFGGLVMELMPGRSDVSWEAHLTGFGAGVLAAFICPVIQMMPMWRQFQATFFGI